MKNHIYIVRELWPRCKRWESIKEYESKTDALTDFNARLTPEPDDGYKISGAPSGKILVQCFKISIVAEQTI